MTRSFHRAAGPALLMTLATGWSAVAHAQAPQQSQVAADLTTLQALQNHLAQQDARIDAQQRLLAEQQAMLDAQRVRLERMDAQRILDAALFDLRGAGAVAQPAPTQVAEAQAAPPLTLPTTPVGEPQPSTPESRVEIAALPEGASVLTPRGHLVVESSLDYTHGSSNRLVFRGVEIVTGVQIGVIEASDADRNAVSSAIGLRYGLANRIELEARFPYVYRSDRVTTLAQRDTTVTRTMSLKGYDVGDIEFAGRYQINRGLGGWPVFLLGLRAKSDTGTSPFEIDRDEFGIAKKLATGSGFWGVDTSVTLLYPSDPVVIFGSVDYLAHLAKNIDKTIGDVPVGRVDPGDSLGFSLGFGFALNPRFSISMGYKHNYVFKTMTELGGTKQKSTSLQVGGVTLGLSFRMSDTITLSNIYEIGTTSDAPDMRVMFRIPFRF